MNRITMAAIFFYSTLAGTALAADIPADVLGSEKFDAQACINNTAESCINSICLTSDQVDCEENCNKMAQEKCQDQMAE